jgi:hypothetical protein
LLLLSQLRPRRRFQKPPRPFPHLASSRCLDHINCSEWTTWSSPVALKRENPVLLST